MSTQISKQVNSHLSGPWLIRGQLYGHNQCIVHVYTQLGARHRKFGMSVNIAGGSNTNSNKSKYVEDVIEMDELNKGNLSSAAEEDI